MRRIQPALMFAFVVSVGGCSHEPSLVGTWKAAGPLNETITLTLGSNGAYESAAARTPTGTLLTNYRSGTYQLVGDRMFQTQFKNVTMAGSRSNESIDLPAIAVHWISNDKFRAVDPAGDLTFSRDNSAGSSLTLR